MLREQSKLLDSVKQSKICTLKYNLPGKMIGNHAKSPDIVHNTCARSHAFFLILGPHQNTVISYGMTYA